MPTRDVSDSQRCATPRVLVSLMLVVAMAVGSLGPGAVQASAPAAPAQAPYELVFPDVPGGFNGMKVGYTVTGAMLGTPQDGGISMRNYQGRLGTGTLTVAGWVEQSAGYGASLSIRLTAGANEEVYSNGGTTPWRHEFSVSVPIPPGETKGSFSIWLTGSYNVGDRDLWVLGDFAPEHVVPVTVAGQAYTPLHRVDSNRGFPPAVRSSERAPLPGIAVDLVRVEQAAGGPQVRTLASTVASKEGQYTFANVPVTTSLAISGGLQSADLVVLDAAASPANYNPLPSPASPVYAISRPFDVAGTSDVTADLAFDRDSTFTFPPAGHDLLPRLDAFGLLYFHTWQALQLASQLGVVLDTRPLPVYGYLDDASGAYWWGPNSAGGSAAIPPHIAVGGHVPAGGVAASHVNDGSRADNREWHEFGHHFMADAFGNLMPNDNAAPRVNHNGYMNASTSDSWTEGFAEFFAMLVNREIGQDGTPPQIYDWGGSASNLEANWLSWGFRGSQSFEEFAVASLLWDLLDTADANDKTVLAQGGAGGQTATYADRVEVPLATLWSYLAHDRGGTYGYNLHIKHLYDVLKSNGVGAEVGGTGLSALDEIFVAHGFFADTGAHRGYYDAGETIGSTGYLTYTVTFSPTLTITIPARPQRPSPPPVPDAAVVVNVVDEAGAPVTATQYSVTATFDAPYSLYNYSFDATATGGRLFFLPAPDVYPGTVTVAPKGIKVDAPLVLTNAALWTTPPDANGVIASHTFHADTSGSLYLPAVAWQPPPTRVDNFCNPASGWPSSDSSTHSLHYLAGPPCQYQVRINSDNRMAAATPNWQATNFTLEATVHLDEAHTGGAGLLLAVNSDWSRFYVFGIGTNQKFWLTRLEGGTWHDVIVPTTSTAFSRSADNRLRIVNQGGQLVIYANSMELGRVDDGATHAGRVGIYGEGLSGFDARFRDFALWEQAATGAAQATEPGASSDPPTPLLGLPTIGDR